MTKSLALFAALLAASPAAAQTGVIVTTPGMTAPPVAQGGSPATANSGPGSVGYATLTGRAADRISNDPAEAGNAELQTRPIPNSGGGGGGGSGGR